METPIDHSYAVHPRGQVEVHTGNRVAFLAIPKNASTTIRDSAEHDMRAVCDSWIRDHRVWDTEDYDRLCVILRDPVDRYISALNMFFGTERGCDDPHSLSSHMRRNHDGTSWIHTHDCHLAPQSSFLIDAFALSDVSIDYFYLKPGIIDDINRYYGIKLKTDPSNAREHTVITGVNESAIQSAYKADYELIKNVNFVNHI